MLTVADRIQIPSKTTHKDTCLRGDVSYFRNKGNRRRLHAGNKDTGTKKNVSHYFIN